MAVVLLAVVAFAAWVGWGAPRILASGSGWTLTVHPGPELRYDDGGGTTGVSDYTEPVTVNEAVSLLASRDGATVTLVAGPVSPQTSRVVVESVDGDSVSANLVQARGWLWFWAELPGDASVASIEVLDVDGQSIDTFSHPPMPPPTGPPPEPMPPAD